MDLPNEVLCCKCRTNGNLLLNTNESLKPRRDHSKNSTCNNLSLPCRRTQHQNVGIISIIIFIGLLITPLASAQSLDAEEYHDSEGGMYHQYLSNQTQVINVPLHSIKSPSQQVETPKIAALRKDRKGVKCHKNYRKTWCHGNGKCHYVEALKEKACHCFEGWEGARCETPAIEFSSDNQGMSREAIIAAVVVSFVAAAAIIMITCICWRRMRNVKRELEEKELEKSGELLTTNEPTSDFTVDVDE